MLSGHLILPVAQEAGVAKRLSAEEKNNLAMAPSTTAAAALAAAGWAKKGTKKMD